MKSDIQSETAAIFFLANIYLKHGIGQVYVLVDFIYMGSLDLRTENYKMKISCPHGDSIPGHFAFEANSLSVARLVEISIEHLNVDWVLPEFSI